MSDSSNVKFNNGGSLQAFLTQVINEGVKSSLAQKAMNEKEKQDAIVKSRNEKRGESDEQEDGSLFGGKTDKKAMSPSAPTSSKTMDDEMEKLKKGDITSKDVVEKLNSIRGGKSFKESHIAKAMDEYIGSLKKAEKVALLAFLKGIAQIVTGEVSGQSATEPSEKPADVEMKKDNIPSDDKKIRHIEPQVLKSKQTSNKKEMPGKEDTTPPAPIVPKKR